MDYSLVGITISFAFWLGLYIGIKYGEEIKNWLGLN